MNFTLYGVTRSKFMLHLGACCKYRQISRALFSFFSCEEFGAVTNNAKKEKVSALYNFLFGLLLRKKQKIKKKKERKDFELYMELHIKVIYKYY